MEILLVVAQVGNTIYFDEFAREFEAVGAELLTLTLVDPPGPRGIEKLASVVEGLR